MVSPRKSIFKRPMRSSAFMSYCVVTSSRFVLYSGTTSVSGLGEITTPAACVDAWRASPSSRSATAIKSFSRSSLLIADFNCGASSSASFNSIPSVVGISLAMRSTSPYGMSIARPTSFTAAFAAMVPNVIICATFSRPYFWVTYSINSPRRRMQKSISISGMETRSGFRKRSNSRLYCNGSTSVMRSA